MEEIDTFIVRECHIPLSDVEGMGLYDKYLLLGYKPSPKPVSRRSKFWDDKPEHLRMPRVKVSNG